MYIITHIDNNYKYPKMGKILIDETGIWTNAVQTAVELVMSLDEEADESKVREELLNDGDYPSRNANGSLTGEWTVSVSMSD